MKCKVRPIIMRHTLTFHSCVCVYFFSFPLFSSRSHTVSDLVIDAFVEHFKRYLLIIKTTSITKTTEVKILRGSLFLEHPLVQVLCRRKFQLRRKVDWPNDYLYLSDPPRTNSMNQLEQHQVKKNFSKSQ